MHRAWRTWSILLVLGLVALGGMSWMAERMAGIAASGHDADARTSDKAPTPLRLVSLAPSLTETVFALGAGSRLVGVTTHCAYPPEAVALPKIGSYQGPNYEAIYALKPDLVLLLKEHAPAVSQLQAAGLATLMVDQRSWGGLLDSFEELGLRLGRTEEAGTLRADFMERLEATRAASAGKPSTRLLLVIGRAAGAGGIRDVYVAGKGTVYDPLLEAAGCVNAYEGDLGFPVLSAEGIVTINPDAIVELLAMDGKTAPPVAQAQADWMTLKTLRAGKTGRIGFIHTDYAFVPGPRFSRLAMDIFQAVNGGNGEEREASHASE